MSQFTAEALSIIAKRRRDAQRKSDEIYENAINSSKVLSSLNDEIKTASRKLFLSLTTAENTEDAQSELDELKNKFDKCFKAEGIDKNVFLPKYFCPLCEDKGYVNGKKCACLSRLEKELAIKKLGDEIPLENSTFDKFDLKYYPENARDNMKDIFDFCTEYADSFKKNSGSILMTGNTGLGKTHLSLSIVNKIIESGYSAAYGSAQNFLSKIESEHFGRGNYDEDLLSSLIDCDLLVFDDLGTEFSSSFVMSVLYTIINTRLLASRPTIINTNLSLEEIKGRYGDRIASRIMGSYEILSFEGEDIRIQKRIESLSK